MESKKDIRRISLNKRNALSEELWRSYTASITETVISHPFFQEASVIYSYVDYRNEVGTRAMIEAAWKSGKNVAVPKVEGDEMSFYYISHWDDLEEGYKGILEPTDTTIALDDSGLIIMPGAAFDKNRNRIGYGKGFYDKFLQKHSGFHTIALGFSCQIVDYIPTDNYDMKPQVLITEENIYDEFFAK